MLSKRHRIFVHVYNCDRHTILLITAIVQNANCINSHDLEDGDFDDCVLFRVDSTGSVTSDSFRITSSLSS